VKFYLRGKALFAESVTFVFGTHLRINKIFG
jgi:hypothetical protein